jgi:hypothetical protein
MKQPLVPAVNFQRPARSTGGGVGAAAAGVADGGGLLGVASGEGTEAVQAASIAKARLMAAAGAAPALDRAELRLSPIRIEENPSAAPEQARIGCEQTKGTAAPAQGYFPQLF